MVKKKYQKKVSKQMFMTTDNFETLKGMIAIRNMNLINYPLFLADYPTKFVYRFRVTTFVSSFNKTNLLS